MTNKKGAKRKPTVAIRSGLLPYINLRRLRTVFKVKVYRRFCNFCQFAPNADVVIIEDVGHPGASTVEGERIRAATRGTRAKTLVIGQWANPAMKGDAYLRMPFGMSDLIAKIRSLL